MTTITIEVTDEQAQQLAEEAERLSLPVQEWTVRRLFAPAKDTGGPPADVSFEEAMEYVFQKNSELYRRLA